MAASRHHEQKKYKKEALLSSSSLVWSRNIPARPPGSDRLTPLQGSVMMAARGSLDFDTERARIELKQRAASYDESVTDSPAFGSLCISEANEDGTTDGQSTDGDQQQRVAQKKAQPPTPLAQLNPPVARARRRLHRSTHGHARPDDFHWTRRPSQELSRLIEAENDFTDSVSRHWSVQPDELLAEFAARRGSEVNEEPGVPTESGAVRIERHDPKRGDHVIHIEVSASGEEQVLVDLNEHNALIVGDLSVSPSVDRPIVAYSIDEVGDEDFTFLFRDVKTGELLPTDEISNAFYTCAWASESIFLYTEIDECHRPWRVLRHELGTPSENDEIVYEERDRLFEVTLSLSASGKYVLTEVLIISTKRPRAAPRVLWRRKEGVLVDASDNGTHWFLVHNDDDCVQFRIDACVIELDHGGAAQTPGLADWFVVVPHDPRFFRRYACPYERGLAVIERSTETALAQIVLYPGMKPGSVVPHDGASGGGDGTKPLVIRPDLPIYDLTFNTDMPFNTPRVRYMYSSFRTPDTIVEVDMVTGERTVLYTKKVLGFNPDEYVEGREWAVSDDGTRVPISYCFRIDGGGGSGGGVNQSGAVGPRPKHPRPTVLRAYGAYGVSSAPTFNARMLSLLNRGLLYAVAHVRGGSDLGREWYMQGKLASKLNTFVDFIACARHMIAADLAEEGRICSWGRSAGGLLVTASANMTGKSLFRGVVARVPFTDVVTSMQDDSIPLIAQERLEWGNPDKVADYHHMLSYSPYDNIGPTRPKYYYVSAGLADSRVLVHEPIKFVTKLRVVSQGTKGSILLRVNDSGHFISEGTSALDEDVAEVYAFVIHVLLGYDENE
jgi:oligopeptidase B